MNSLRSLSLSLVLLSCVLGSAVVTQAQEAVQGQFTLPYLVHWENTVVPAGKYNFSVKEVGASGLLMLEPVGGNSEGIFILLHAADEMKTGNPSQLVMVSHEGQWFVSSLRLANLGMALRFTVPEMTHPVKQIARAMAKTAEPPAR